MSIDFFPAGGYCHLLLLSNKTKQKQKQNKKPTQKQSYKIPACFFNFLYLQAETKILFSVS